MTRPVLVRRGLTALAVTAAAAVVAVPAWALFSVLSTNASVVAAAGVLGTPVATTSGASASTLRWSARTATC